MDGEALVEGLARLGVGISDAAAEVLVGDIAKNNAMFFRAEGGA